MDDHWLLIVLGQAVGFLQGLASIMAAWIITHAWKDPDQTVWGLWIAVFIVIAIAINWTLVFIHEMGHALAAWSARRNVLVINVRGLSYAPKRKQFYTEAGHENREYAGYIVSDPIWPDLGTGKSIWVSLGGPLATGLTGLAFFVFAPKFGHYQFPTYFLSAAFMLDMVFNLTPLKWANRSYSDGLNIIRALKGEGWTPNIWAQARISARPLRTDLVSAQEWAALKPYIVQPFFGGPDFRKLLAHAAKEHGDDVSLSHLPSSLLQPPLQTELTTQKPPST